MQPGKPEVERLLKFEPLNPWREAALIGMILMELSWIIPWFRSLTWVTASFLPLHTFLVLGGVFIVTNLFTRLVNALQLKIKYRQLIMLVFLLLCVFLTTRLLASGSETGSSQALIQEPLELTSQFDLLMAGNILVGITTVLVIWRGMVLAREYAGPISVFESLQLGIILLGAYSIIIAGPMHANPTGYVVLFLSSALLAMVSARIAILSRLRGGVRHTFDRKWFFGIIAAITSILLAALAFANLVIGQMERLARAIQAIYVTVVTIIAVPILFILALINPKFPTLQLIQPTPTPESEPSASSNDTLLKQMQDLQDPSLLTGLAPFIKLILVWGIILLIVFLLARQFKIWRMDNRGENDTERQSLLDEGGLRKLLSNNLRKLFNNLSNLKDVQFLQLRDRRKAAERIRRIYEDMIENAADLGKPRPEADTPLEYLVVLNDLFPESEQDLDKITSAYLKVRYGELPEKQAEVEAVEAAWLRLEKLIGVLKKSQKTGSKKTVPATG